MTIHCTNPTCKTIIPVPEGTTYVVCPVCNTWHFPSDYEGAAGGSPSTGNMDYGSPSAPPLQPEAPASTEYPSSDAYPAYPSDGAYLPSHDPTFHRQVVPEKKEGPPIGQIVMPDGRQLPLKVGINIIGRKCGELSINDATVSRKHCVIEVSPKPAGGGWDYLLYDIGAMEGTASTNGVFVSGRSLRLQNYEKVPVSNGARIQLGSVSIILQYHIS